MTDNFQSYRRFFFLVTGDFTFAGNKIIAKNVQKVFLELVCLIYGKDEPYVKTNNATINDVINGKNSFAVSQVAYLLSAAEYIPIFLCLYKIL